MHNHFKTLTLLLAGALAFGASAQSSRATATVDGRAVTATLLRPNIVKVVNTPAGEAEPAPQVVLPLEQNLPMATALDIQVAENGTLTITDTANGTVLTDRGDRRTADGLYTLTLTASGRGSFYGGGERGHKFNFRGDTLVNYNRQNYGYTGTDSRISQMNITMPVVLNSNGFALLFDDFAASTMVLGDTIVYSTEAPVPVTYYYIGGVTSMAALTEQLTLLTGRQPLPPLWALGYINSKYGYKTPAETVEVVDSLKNMGYPLDGTVLDLYWFGKEQDMGFLDWDRTVWPDPAGMMRDLKARGVNLVTVSEPYILTNGTGVDNFVALSNDSLLVRTAEGDTHPVTIWVGEGGMFDVSNPKTQQWLHDRYKMLTDLGIGGWWGDLGEPEVHPETGMHANGLTARQYHNRYGNDWAAIIRRLYEQEYPDTRLMTLMRGGTIGLQRESVFPWSTDVSRSWGGLQPQVRIMLNSGLSGLGYMSSDLGGFAVDEANPFIPELYLRWLEMGLFTPVFRTHAQQYAEPFNYPMYAEQLLNIAKERYRWLPYNYTLAFQNAFKGWPLVRPLGFHGNAGSAYDAAADDQYLWGRDVMVAPVLTEGTMGRKVVFPAGDDWYSADATRLYRGGTEQYVDAPLGFAPIFYRAGAVIPTADYDMANTGDFRSDTFTINYYPGEDAEFTLFDDDKSSPASLASRDFRLFNFSGGTVDGVTTLTLTSDGSYEGAPEIVDFRFVIHAAETPKSVTVNGVPVENVYNVDNKTMTFSLHYTVDSEAVITINPLN